MGIRAVEIAPQRVELAIGAIVRLEAAQAADLRARLGDPMLTPIPTVVISAAHTFATAKVLGALLRRMR